MSGNSVVNDPFACVTKDDNKKPCTDKSLKNKSAKSACQEIKQKSDDLQKKDGFGKAMDDLAAFNPVTLPLTVIGKFFDLLGSNAKSTQNIINDLKTKIDTKTIIDQASKCIQNTTQIQSNTINGISPDCVAALGNTFPSLGQSALQSKISGVTQQNTAQAKNTCKIDLVLNVLSKMDASIDNSAIQTALNSAKGLMSKSDSSQDICNNISTEMSACKYINQQQCCSQNVKQTQSNLLDSGCQLGGIENIMQSNSLSAENNCILSSQTSVTDDLSSHITNSVSQSATNKSEGLTMGFLIVFLIIVCIIIGGPFVIGGLGGRSILRHIVPILIFVGIIVCIIFTILFIFSIKPEHSQSNQPYTACTGTKVLGQVSRSTFAGVKDRVNQPDVIGYDFFIDVGDDQKASDIDTTNISDQQLGSVYYITVLPDASAPCTSVDNDKNAIISYVKQQRNDRFLAIAISGAVLAIIMTLFFIFGPKPKPLPTKEYEMAKLGKIANFRQAVTPAPTKVQPQAVTPAPTKVQPKAVVPAHRSTVQAQPLAQALVKK